MRGFSGLGRLAAMAAMSLGAMIPLQTITITPPTMPTPKRRPRNPTRTYPYPRGRTYTRIGDRERGRYGTDKSLHGLVGHWLQRASHPNGLPNHCIGVPSNSVVGPGGMVTRRAANKESW